MSDRYGLGWPYETAADQDHDRIQDEHDEHTETRDRLWEITDGRWPQHEVTTHGRTPGH